MKITNTTKNLKDRITNVRISKDDENTPCVKFNIDGVEWLEWITESSTGNIYIEYTDSNLKCHYDSDLDVDDILEYLDSQI